jgi:hypothetical protein
LLQLHDENEIYIEVAGHSRPVTKATEESVNNAKRRRQRRRGGRGGVQDGRGWDGRAGKEGAAVA